ncbi:helix-turn-helix domain-containing protein [Mariniluteicoccus flavus]
MVAARPPRGARITGADRDALVAQLARRYAAGESIRSMATDTGRSYGFVQGLLKESGVELRTRGGATRGAEAVAARQTTQESVAAVRAELAARPAARRARAKSAPAPAKSAPARRTRSAAAKKVDAIVPKVDGPPTADAAVVPVVDPKKTVAKADAKAKADKSRGKKDDKPKKKDKKADKPKKKDKKGKKK